MMGQIYLIKNVKVFVEFRNLIIKALEDKYNAQVSEAHATISIYLSKSVGIGEHPQHVEEVDKLIDKIAQRRKVNVLQSLKYDK